MTAPHKPARNPRLAESFQRDALLAWRDYRATGWYVSAAAADAWLARLQRGDAIAPPDPQR